VFLFVLSCSLKKDLSIPILLDYNLYYPDNARLKGLEGLVLVKVYLDDEGKTKEVEIAKSSGIEILDSAAVKAARTFIFAPVMVGDKPISSRVIVPIRFIYELEVIDPFLWLNEVKTIQKEIEKDYQEEKINNLYNKYKELIYSPRNRIKISTNYYIKRAVLKQTEKLWDGYWLVYPAPIILFFDIINRFPDSFVSFEARDDLNSYYKEEILEIRSSTSSVHADSIIKRLSKAVQDLSF